MKPLDSLNNTYNQIEEVIQSHHDEIGSIANRLKQDYQISNLAETIKELKSLEDESKVLRVGIVGRVKAGKSSLLNALLFNGEDILPKAATPMTAALTIIKHHDEEGAVADLDFYTEEDIQQIKKGYDNYLQEKEQLIAEYTKKQQNNSDGKISKILNPTKSKEEKEKLAEKIEKQVERTLRNSPNNPSYDQYQRIKNSNTNLTSLKQQSQLKASNITELVNDQLEKFVGADGQYMPFTKSVTLSIHHEGLKGLEIIDTPGINDPVQSRGKRTDDMLQSCDVIFLISPAGQFLSHEDMELMKRITSREGIQEVYIIASQTDNQLFGSEKADTLNLTLKNIRQSLTDHARQTLREDAKNNPYSKLICDKAQTHEVICTSGVAYSMSQRLGNQSSWDANLQHVWQNLKTEYPDAFTNEQSTKIMLDTLANIEQLQDILKDVHQRKEDIQKNRIIELQKQKTQSLQEYLESLCHYIQNRLKDLDNSDIAKIRQEQKFLDNKLVEIKLNINNAIKDINIQTDLSIRDKLLNTLEEIIKDFQANAEKAESEEKEEYKELVKKAPWWKFWAEDEYKTESRKISLVSATQVVFALKEMRSNIEDRLATTAKIGIKERQTYIQSQITKAMRGANQENDENIDIKQLNEIILNILSLLPKEDFKLKHDLPNQLNKTGSLKGNACEEFLDNVQNYIGNLKSEIRSDIKIFVQKINDNLEKAALAETLTNSLKKEQSNKIHELENIKLTKAKYARIEQKLNQLKETING